MQQRGRASDSDSGESERKLAHADSDSQWIVKWQITAHIIIIITIAMPMSMSMSMSLSAGTKCTRVHALANAALLTASSARSKRSVLGDPVRFTAPDHTDAL